MINEQPTIGRLRAVVAIYLSGDLDFDTAVEQLVAILRSIREPQVFGALFPQQREPRHRIRILKLSPEQWQDPPRLRPTVQVKLLELAPGHSPKEEHRARAVFAAAWRRAFLTDK